MCSFTSCWLICITFNFCFLPNPSGKVLNMHVHRDAWTCICTTCANNNAHICITHAGVCRYVCMHKHMQINTWNCTWAHIYSVSQKKCSRYEGLHAPGAWGLSCTGCMVTLMHLVHEVSHAPKKYNIVLCLRCFTHQLVYQLGEHVWFQAMLTKDGSVKISVSCSLALEGQTVIQPGVQGDTLQ